MTTSTESFRDCNTDELLAQIGHAALLFISGGRVRRRASGVTLPVAAGYSVTVDLDWNDTYVVRRVFKRGDKVTIKGEMRDVYAMEVSEAAIQASSFRSYPFPKP